METKVSSEHSSGGGLRGLAASLMFVAGAWPRAEASRVDASQGEAQPVQSGPPAPEVRTDNPAPNPAQDVADASRPQDPPIGPLPPPSAVPAVPLESIAHAPLPPFKPSYRSFADAALLIGAYANAASDVATAFELGLASDGRPVPALEIATRRDVPKGERPTVFLIGALDGRSAAGAESVLGIVHQLLAAPERLPSDVTIVAIPWASPEGLDVLAAGGVSDGANLRPVDDDRDGALDEDPPDDLNDDGLILQMLIEDPRGEWVRCSDGRFLAPAGPLDQPRYHLVLEGRDDDGDGRFNEDGRGGVVLDKNFPLGRVGPWLDPRSGTLPMSEPLTRALADLVLARKTAAVLLFQGNHGGVAIPGGVAALDGLVAGDKQVYERIAAQFAIATGRTGEVARSARAAVGADRPGCALDWFAGVAGALAVELASWGPRVDNGADVAVRDARFNGANGGARTGDSRPAPADEMRAWANWIDNRHGGIGFDDWQPIGPQFGVNALLGGWRPRTLFDPPEEALPRALQGQVDFVLELVDGLPKLEVHVVESARDGDVCRMRVRVENRGALPTGPSIARTARGASGIALELGLPPGARLLAGTGKVEIERLVGRQSSREIGWIALAAPGSAFELRVDAPWCARVVREVKP